VASVCCALGEGTPTAANVQAFQTALSRNGISVKLPTAAPATRAGAGYAQTLTASDGSCKTYVIAEADNSNTAYLLTGDLYAAYLANGGFTGALGYPASDPLPGGVQQFTSGAALAGSPATVVAAPVAAKWFAVGGISGAPGAPTAAATTFATASGRTGTAQSFVGGAIYAVTSSPGAGTYFSYGLILARYLTVTGPAGGLGAPTSDISISSTGVALQTFEGGTIDLQPGATAAVEHYNPRRPTLTATPTTVIPGGKVHIAATGFAPGATLAFTISGQPNFSTVSPSGAFQWDIVVPGSAKSGTVSLQVAAQTGSDKASASYSIAPAAAALPKITLVSGDRQTAIPGSLLPSPIVALLQDVSGAPLSGVPVSVTASPGAAVSAPPVTDDAGMVRVSLRLPPTAGVAVGSISAAGKTADFSALATAGGIANFPQFTQNDPSLLGPGPATLAQQGGLVTTLAALIRYQQNVSALATANGLASPAALNTWLTGAQGYLLSENGNPIADPWVAAQFAKGAFVPLRTSLDAVRDAVNGGQPVGLVLNLSAAGQAVGSATVAAVGVSGDGSIQIADPNPAFARTSLSDYLTGFPALGQTIQGTLAVAFQIAPAAPNPAAAPFVVASTLAAGSTVGSPAGYCPAVDLLDPLATQLPSGKPGGARFAYCDGSQAAYEDDFAKQTGATLVDLAAAPPTAVALAPSSVAAIQIVRSNGLQVSPLVPSIASVLDSAGYNTALAPGGLVSIFGLGLSGNGNAPPTVTAGNAALKILANSPFQINAALPDTLAPGSATLTVTGAAGTATRSITVSATAPGIFVLGSTAGRSIGAVVNADGTVNGTATPAQRGQYISIYCAGLGATTASGSTKPVTTPVTAVIDGTVVPTSFAGLLPGFVGLYQVNLTIPATLAPSANAALTLRQSGKDSNAVPLAYQ
jgi:uncharacterized protein (TIGR03437 family)